MTAPPPPLPLPLPPPAAPAVLVRVVTAPDPDPADPADPLELPAAADPLVWVTTGLAVPADDAAWDGLVRVVTPVAEAAPLADACE